MRYSWNVEKNSSNIDVHGIDFEDAIGIFEGPTLERVDDRYDYGEVRVQAIGLFNGVEITLVYTDKKDTRHIITAWRSTRHEREIYWKKITG